MSRVCYEQHELLVDGKHVHWHIITVTFAS
jgi:hypothetical protein